eukprot:TRINITY_DN1645_c0_g1_i1.p1 TRINITY_DN1645_c0_g1~~TRINITY_DN1645_c0_g1_i1.p1  ORF type:complete len:923 (+),score=219.21 TRINITY_DN1645_c0_g1_i1:41-2809(+)
MTHELIARLEETWCEDPTAPFTNDDDYFQQAHYVLALIFAGNKRWKEKEATLVAREALAPEPCLVGVVRKLGLPRVEVRGLQWVVLHNTGCQFECGRDYEDRIDATNLCRAAGMTPSQLLRFISNERRHIAEGLIELEDRFDDTTVRGQCFKMPRQVLCGLLGVHIPPAEYLKISNTALSEYLEETGRQQPLLPQDVEDASGGTDDVDLDADNDDLNLSPPPVMNEKEDPAALQPYTDDLEYLSDRFEVVLARLRMYKIGMKDDDDRRLDRQRPESVIRELQGMEKAALKKCEVRLSLTKSFTPRVEQIKQSKGLSEFETWVVITLIAGVISQDVRRIGSMSRLQGTLDFDVGSLLGIHCYNDLKSQMENRRCFHKRSPLVSLGIVRVVDSRRFSSDLMDCMVDLDRRMLDFFVGLDTQFSDIIDAANLYTPEVDLSSVVLPEQMKDEIIATVTSYEAALQYRKDIGFHDIIGGYGAGVVLLFHGPPGTGKTMMANGLAKKLGKQLLLVTISILGESPTDTIRQVFREAAIQDALVFFDECDSMLETRDASKLVTLLLTELERFTGLLILATNRPMTLDEALSRRITLSVEFPHPDVTLRERIWKKHIPEKLHTKDVNWTDLAVNYELSGGFIKNAVVNAITAAVTRDAENPIVTGKDLDLACQQQVRGRLMVMTKSRSTPKRGLTALIVDEKTLVGVQNVIGFERAKGVMKSQWGFKEDRGTIVVFKGAKGVGKGLAAEVVAFELARALQVVSVMEVMAAYRTATMTVASLFTEARDNNLVLLIEGIEELRDTDTYRTFTTYLCFHAQRTGGLVILSTTPNYQPPITPTFQVSFTKPSQPTRRALWRAAAPVAAPMSPGIDYNELSKDELTGSQIMSAMQRAAAHTVATHQDTVTMETIKKAVEMEMNPDKIATSLQSMYC